MGRGHIAIIDSGIGGLNLLKNLCLTYPNEKYVYFGDNENAPYGNKSIDELFDISKRNVEYLKKFNIKRLILGCNTLSTCLLNEISCVANIKTIGVQPPVDYALKRYNKVLLVATNRTAERFNDKRNLDVIGFENLAEDIEKNVFNLSSVKLDWHLKNKKIINDKKTNPYDAIILGCTHYGFIKKQFIDHFRPRNLLCSEDFFEDKRIIDDKILKSQVNYKDFSVLFVGRSAKFNKKVWCFMWS